MVDDPKIHDVIVSARISALQRGALTLHIAYDRLRGERPDGKRV
jgi:hypothetical protein